MVLPRVHPNCCPCDCVKGSLPATLTLTFNGVGCDPAFYVGANFLSHAACFGDGLVAAGWASTAPGPMTTTFIKERGSGFALIGRSAPTLAANADTGSGASLSVTLGTDKNGHLDYWGIAAVTVNSAGTGYTDGADVTISHVDADSVGVPAVVKLRSTRTQPTLTASAIGGSGGSLAVNLVPVAWGVASVSGTATGINYGDAVAFTAAPGVSTAISAQGIFKTVLEAPSVTIGGQSATVAKDAYPDGRPYWRVTGLSASATGAIIEVLTAGGAAKIIVTGVDSSGFVTSYHICDGGHMAADTQSGSELVITRSGEYSTADDPTAEPTVTVTGQAGCTVTLTPVAWGVASVTISNGGAGYTSGSALAIETGDTTAADCEATITTNGSGAITGVTVNSPGRYYRLGGIDSAVVLNHGQYWRDDSAATPYVAEVFLHAPASTPATISATVDSDLTSATWSQVTALLIDDGGDGYETDQSGGIPGYGFFGWYPHDLDGTSVVFSAVNARPLVKYRIESCFGTGAAGGIGVVAEDYYGGTSPVPATAEVIRGGSGYAIYGREAPTVSIEASGGGSGCVFTPTWSEDTDECGRTFFTLASVSVLGGTDYIDGAELTFTVTSGTLVDNPSATLSVADGVPVSVAVTRAGKGWRSNPSLPAIVSAVTVVVEQDQPSSGSGAAVTAQVDSDTSHETFGTIISLAVEDQGSGYTLRGGPLPISNYSGTGCQYLGGIKINPDDPSYESFVDVGSSLFANRFGVEPYDTYIGWLTVWYRGHGEKMYISVPALSIYGSESLGWVSVDPVTDCNFASLEFQPAVGTVGTITITPGGLGGWDRLDRCP